MRLSEPDVSAYYIRVEMEDVGGDGNDESRHDLFISKGVRWNLLPDAGDMQPISGGPESPSGKRGWRGAWHEIEIRKLAFLGRPTVPCCWPCFV